MGPARRRDGAGRAPGAARAPWRKRARAFAFEGLPEKDRFGVFDPALRATYLFLLLLGEVLLVGSLFDRLGGVPAAWVLSAVGGLALLAAGAYGYFALWTPPAEREVLLQMAREDEESRALRARLVQEQAARARGEGPGGEAGGGRGGAP